MQNSLLILLLVALTAGPLAAAEKKPHEPTFEKHVRPILKAHCFECHGEQQDLEGSLDLRLRRLIAEGGDSGPAIAPGNLDESLLYQRIAQGEMPPGKVKLSAEQIDTIGRWIAAGAKTARPEPEKPDPLGFTAEDRQHWAFQPIRKPAPPSPQGSKGIARIRNPVDAFLLERLEQQQLDFSPEADKRTLIRRATFDLLGLPPTPEEVAMFLADEAPDAYDRLIDRLLASPRYGERWARHWLDIAGYADSEGFDETDAVRSDAWRYRDYVIRSLNADKPFDEFIVEQLAGDELVSPPYQDLSPEALERLTATGFLRMAPDGTASREADQNMARNQVVTETVKIVSSSLLGMTVGCAECHDHRFDPILQSDFYRLRAVFEPALDVKNWRTPRQRQISLATPEDRAKSAELERQAAEADRVAKAKEAELMAMVFEEELAKLPAELHDSLRTAWQTPAAKRTDEQQKLLEEYPSANVRGGGPLNLYLELSDQRRKHKAEWSALQEKAAKIRAGKPQEEFLRVLTEIPGQLPKTYLFHRGDSTQPKQEIPPGVLTILCTSTGETLPLDDPALPTSGRRLALARHLTSGQHPLVPRVLVNRFWLHHFGRGIVATPGDFGLKGELPTHPELLDWLANEFVDGGWRLKWLHKLMMTSTAYRQSSRRRAEADRVDPDNKLCARMNVRRLEAEMVRDAILAASGQLSPQMFGAPAAVRVDDSGQIVESDAFSRASRREEATIIVQPLRRSIYVQTRRSTPLAVLDTFDAPAMEPNCELRTASTVTPQSLLLMNSAFVITQSEQFAQRVRRQAGDDAQAQCQLAWQIAFAAEPAPEELAAMTKFLDEQSKLLAARTSQAKPATDKADGKSGDSPPSALDARQQALASLCQTLLGANQFLYVD
jgi:hypothetical protein